LERDQILFDCGIYRAKQRRATEALDAFYQAEAAGADADACASQRWYCWMLLGEFENAWRESDAIATRNRLVANCFWDGAPFDGKRVMVRSLHGYGDAIQFLRYLPFLKERAACVILETHPDLVSLAREQSYLDLAISWEDKSHAYGTSWDQQIELMEFPRAFRTSLRNLPCAVPYLNVSEATVDRVVSCLRRALSTRDWSGEPKVGLVWGASDWDASRSLPIVQLSRILAVPGVAFFSFQHGRQRGDLVRLKEIAPVEDTAAFCETILDTAAALTQMDLVITVDTMVAHLAGALARPVWTLLQWCADWRWMLQRDDSPWYPTMRLFRQDQSQDWRQPVTSVVAELQRLAATGSQW